MRFGWLMSLMFGLGKIDSTWQFTGFLCLPNSRFDLKDRVTTNLVSKALMMAIGKQNPRPGLIHNSDRGSQYVSRGYQKSLKKQGMNYFMSRKGSCWNDAVVERF